MSTGAHLPTSLAFDQLHALARHGAGVRIAELEQEIAAIRATFPDLSGAKRSPRQFGRPRGTRKRGKLSAEGRRKIAEAQRKRWAALKAKGTTKRGRKRHEMSPAMRKAVSERMKKYWAERRKTKTDK